MAIAVQCKLLPSVAELVLWGQHSTGWFGLCRWTEQHRDDGHTVVRTIGSGWVSSHDLFRGAGDERRVWLPRLTLPEDEKAWPLLWLPSGRTVTHRGKITTALPRSTIGHGSLYG